MEKDIDLIIDVDPDEAQQLIELVEILIKDWYVARYDRAERMRSIVGLAKAKKQQKDSNRLLQSENGQPNELKTPEKSTA